MKQLKLTITGAACLAMLCTVLCRNCLASPPHPESSDPIKIIISNWTSQQVLSKIAGLMFTRMGYRISYFPQAMDTQWGVMARGKAHIQMEVWEGTNTKMFKRMVELGKLLDAGNYSVNAREDWWYPDYVEPLCPGLPDWRALKKCHALFATDKTRPYGRYITGPWEETDRARIDALGLKFRVDRVPDGKTLNKKIMTAVKNNRPIIVVNWTPNWVETVIPGKFVEFPAWSPECETDPQWGPNNTQRFDCGKPRHGWVKKGAWAGMPGKWPCAFHTLQRMDFTNAAISRLVYEVDIKGLSVEQCAQAWLDTHEELWQSWIPSRCRERN